MLHGSIRGPEGFLRLNSNVLSLISLSLLDCVSKHEITATQPKRETRVYLLFGSCEMVLHSNRCQRAGIPMTSCVAVRGGDKTSDVFFRQN